MGFLGPFSGHIKCLYKRLQVNVLIVKHFLNKENLPVVDFSVHVYWSTLFAQLKNQLFIQLTENHRHGTKINIYHNYQKLSVTDYKWITDNYETLNAFEISWGNFSKK